MRVRRRIAVLNRSTVASDEEIEHICEALQSELDGKFAEAWGTGAVLSTVPKDSDTGWEGKWNVVVLDTMEQAGALGYHDLTPEGKPVGYIGAKTDLEYGALLSVTVSHEVMEMLGDSEINQLAADGRGRICWYENCDAVEADELAVDVGDVKISNYVYPTWFVPSLTGKDLSFDRQGATNAPFQLVQGGYQGYTATWPPNWQQEFAAGTPAERMIEARPKTLSRRYRRILRDQGGKWQRSLSEVPARRTPVHA